MPFPADIVDRMRCPACAGPVTEGSDGLRCDAGHLWRVRNGYVDAVGTYPAVDAETLATASSFGYEWTTFSSVQPEDSEYWEMYFRDVPPEAYEGKVVLDAGCGKGRYTRPTAGRARALVAADNSDAVEAAARNLADCPNVMVVKADLRTLPFEPGTFDFISCLGVLHHLKDPEEGFRSLVRLLRSGGHFLLYVYSADETLTVRSVGLAAAAQLRRLTVRVPHPVLRWLSAPLAGLLYAGVVVPGQMGVRSRFEPLANLPLATYRGKPVRSLWLDTFDRLSAPIEHRYRREQVEGWFARSGLEVLAVRQEAGLFVLGGAGAAAG